MAKVEHGFILSEIRKALDAEDWEDSDEPGAQVRRIFLGTVFSLSPSGKFYMPWASGNVAGCDSCKGTGTLPSGAKRRVLKKWRRRHAKVMARFDALYGEPIPGAPHGNMPSLLPRYRPMNKRAAFAFIDRQPKKYRMRCFYVGAHCRACDGSGSREAHLDELWREAVEEAFSTIGVNLANGEGDPCDLFAEEYRDASEEEDVA